MAEYEPLYHDRHRRAFNFTLLLALVLAAWGLLNGTPQLAVVGIAFAAWAWFTTPNSYTLFRDRLLIAYGRPRLRTILFGQIENVELITLAMMSPRVRVHQRAGRDAWLSPRDPQAFNQQLSDALRQFRGGSTEENLPVQD